MKLKVSHYLLLFFLLLSLFVIVKSLTFHYWEAMVLPLLFSCIILIASALDFGRELKKSRNKTQMDKAEMSRKEMKSEVKLHQFTATLGWIVGFALGTYLLGFFISIPLFIIVYLKGCRQGWRIAIFLAFIMTGSVYVIFELTLNARLYKGLIWKLIPA